MGSPGTPNKSRGTSLLAAFTLLLTLTAAFYAVAIHTRIIGRRHTGFTLDGECAVRHVEPGRPGVAPGDRLVGWRQGEQRGPISSVFMWLKVVERLDYGPVDLTFSRKDGATTTVTWDIRRPPVWPKLGFTLGPLVLCIIAVALLLARRREGDIFYLMVITLVATYILALSYTNLDAIAASPFYLISFLFWNVLAPPSLLLFFLHYPYRKRGVTGTLTALMYVPALISFMVTSYLYVRFYFTPTHHNQESLLFVGRLLIPGTNFLYGLGMVWAIFHSLLRGPSWERPRMILVVYGLFIILLMISSWVFISSRDNALAQIITGPDLLMVMHMVLSISLYSSTSRGWVSLAQRLVNRGVFYVVLTIGILLFYLILSWVLGLLLTQMFGLKSRTVTIFAAVISTAGLFSLREFVQRHIDRMLFRTRYRYGELLKEVSERFSSIMELPRLFSSLLQIIGASMKLRSGAAWVVKSQRGDLIFVSNWGGTEGLPGVLPYGKVRKAFPQEKRAVLLEEGDDTELFGDLTARCVVPLYFQGELYGLIALGDKIEDIPYSRDDADLLESVGKQAAVAVKNSMSYTTILNLNASLASSKAEIERLKGKLEVENVYLQRALQDAGRFGDIVGDSESLRGVKALIEKIAPTKASVLILGESGTGKELIARTIHTLSPMSARPLVTVNCAAIPANLLESELFGHVKGAFTGAVRRKIGQFELADGGTLFLDEIGELPLELQPKILRALQEGEITPVGAEAPLKVDVRLVTATNRELERMVTEGTFREDLYYRINVVPITLPPLRERTGDIGLLAQYFLQMQATRMGKKVEAFSRGAMERLTAYPWPGNVRELSNVVERAVALSSGPVIDAEVMLPEVPRATPKRPDAPTTGEMRVLGESALPGDGAPLLESGLPYKEAVDAFRRQYLRDVLARVGGNKSEAARIIGLQRPYLHKLIRELGVEDPE